MKNKAKVTVLFICMGNICRSPTAHGVFRNLVQSEGLGDFINIDSAGTHAYHVGEPPDGRAQQTAIGRGVDLSDLRARKAVEEDFAHYDYILVMDQDNYHSLSAICPGGMEWKIGLFLDYAPNLKTREVPDPYYGGSKGFDYVFDLVEAASEGLLNDIKRRYLR